VAQFGSALPWGGRGRGFKSRQSDHFFRPLRPDFSLGKTSASEVLTLERGVRRLDFPSAPGTERLFWRHCQLSEGEDLLKEALAEAGVASLPNASSDQARVEDYGEYVHVVLFTFAADPRGLREVPFHVVACAQGVVSWSEQPLALVDELEQRLRQVQSRIARVPLLLYHVLDTLLNDAWHFLDSLNERVSALERAVLRRTGTTRIQSEMLELRRVILRTRRLLGSMRDAVHHLAGHLWLEGAEVVLYFELYDLVLRLFDAVDTYRELLDSLMDIHLASVSNRLNEIVKSLTLVATVMLPPSLVASLYGMNFDHMPGSRHPYGFYVVLGFAMVVSMSLVWWFRRRRWI
jgi:magnesium transporter